MIDTWDGPPEPTGPVIRRSHYDLPWLQTQAPMRLPVATVVAIRPSVPSVPVAERLEGGCELFRLPTRL